MKSLLKKISNSEIGINALIRKLGMKRTLFNTSEQYWDDRYQSGGDSGFGSFNELSQFKATVLNKFVQDKHINSVIEYGCGDGNQLQLSDYPSYLGFDVSSKAISMCDAAFADDPTKKFKLVSNYAGEKAQLTLSLDVTYHIVEDQVFVDYMGRLFNSAQQFVIIYSYDLEVPIKEQSPHVKHRKFNEWIQTNQSDWKLLEHIPNICEKSSGGITGPFADFFIYKKI